MILATSMKNLKYSVTKTKQRLENIKTKFPQIFGLMNLFV